MIPSGYKSGKIYSQKPLSTDGQLTFTRASSATRVESNGLIEKVRENVVPNGLLFNGATGVLYTTITSDTPISGVSSTLITKNEASGTLRYGNQNCSASVLTGSISYTISRYFKYDGHNLTTSLEFNSGPHWGSTSWVQNIDIASTGVTLQAPSNCTSKISNVGNGWYRVEVTILTGASPTGSPVTYLLKVASTLSTGQGFLTAAPQLEISDFGATDYIPTTTAAVSVGPVANIPRLDYYDSTCPKLLLEPQRTNLVLFSEQLNAASWSASTTTVTANAEISPDGYQNADVLAMSASQSRVSQVLSLGAGTYSVSVYAKAISGSGTARILVIIDGVSTDFNFTPTTSWARYSFTFTAATSVTAVQMRAQTFIGNLSFWGCQLELGACATSYIPTLATSQTRVADAALKTGITSLIGQTEGTLFVDAEVTNFAEAAQSFITISDGTITNRVELRKGSPNTIILEGSAATGSFPNITLSSVAVGRYKIAVAYKTGSTALFINGTQIGSTSANAFAFTSLTNVIIGANFSGSTRFLNDRISQALVFKTRLTNDQLAELTSL
jgi:hypothetical protein